ncbi:hypothetical protein, partial [Mesorhizobium sp. M7A.F.Ca.CA.004.08.1.1]|uniref:hypothetical protein n=1 Tax=Mesorhizobium sp. M7A.F.Ca.CA.004.08.1.1 TaxID=2496730 RepID=UPI0013E2B9A6
PDSTLAIQADRVAQTAADLARVPDVAARAVRDSKSSLTSKELLDQSQVEPRENSDILVFKVDSDKPAVARQLATGYAKAFSGYRAELDTRALQLAQQGLRARLRELSARGDEESRLYSQLEDKQQQLS